MPVPKYYDILQVSPSADPEIVDAAWRCLIDRHQPGLGTVPESTRMISLANEARHTLADAARRKAYDDLLELDRKRQAWGEMAALWLRNGLSPEGCVDVLLHQGAGDLEAARLVAAAEELMQKAGEEPPSPETVWLMKDRRHSKHFKWLAVRLAGSVVVWVVILALLGIAGLIVINFFLPRSRTPSGVRLDVGGSQVWRGEGVGEAEAGRFGKYLTHRDLESIGLTYQLRRAGDRHEILVSPLHSPLADDFAAGLARLGADASDECFNGGPVDVIACDSSLYPFRVISHIPVLPALSGIRLGMATNSGRQSLDLENTAESDLSVVEITVTLFRRDGGETSEKRRWEEWRAKEVKSLPVVLGQYDRAELKGTARQNGKKSLMDMAFAFNKN